MVLSGSGSLPISNFNQVCPLYLISVSTWFKSHHLKFYSIVSFHLCLGLPLFLLPFIFNSYIIWMSSSFHLLKTWQNHSKLLFLIRSKIDMTLAFRPILSFFWFLSKLICLSPFLKTIQLGDLWFRVHFAILRFY